MKLYNKKEIRESIKAQIAGLEWNLDYHQKCYNETLIKIEALREQIKSKY